MSDTNSVQYSMHIKEPLQFMFGMNETEPIAILDRRPDVYEQLIHDGKTYIVIMIDDQNKRFVVDEYRPFTGITKDTEEMLCPHCGYAEYDPPSGQEGEASCASCGQEYEFKKHIEITYSTKKIGGAAK